MSRHLRCTLSQLQNITSEITIIILAFTFHQYFKWNILEIESMCLQTGLLDRPTLPANYLIWINCIILEVSGGSKGRGFNPSPPSEKKSSPCLGISLWFGDILSEKQWPICLRLHEKAFGNQKFPRGRAHRPLYSNFFLSNYNPPPLTEKLDPPLEVLDDISTATENNVGPDRLQNIILVGSFWSFQKRS